MASWLNGSKYGKKCYTSCLQNPVKGIYPLGCDDEPEGDGRGGQSREMGDHGRARLFKSNVCSSVKG